MVKEGSPPQVRGKPKQTFRKPTRSRITPAGAGKTEIVLSPAVKNQDHPRRCGENTICGYRRLPAPGSPPQVRGKRNRGRYYPPLRRITPAGAGKTRYSTDTLDVYQDHPRRCGENFATAQGLRSRLGSPPQVRGKLCFSVAGAEPQRITPAGAGKTLQLAVDNSQE